MDGLANFVIESLSKFDVGESRRVVPVSAAAGGEIDPARLDGSDRVDNGAMHLAILGTGAVGPALGRAFTAAGHQVTIGTRDPAETRGRPEWVGSELALAAYPDLQADVFVNSTNGAERSPPCRPSGRPWTARW